MTSGCFRAYHPRDDRQPIPEEKHLTTEDGLKTLTHHAIEKIRAAANDGSLMTYRGALSVLFRWCEFVDDEGAEVRQWTASKMAEDEFIAQMAEVAVSCLWTPGLGDRVAISTSRAHLNGLEKLLDISQFRSRLEELEANQCLASDHKEKVTCFLSAWRRQEQNSD